MVEAYINEEIFYPPSISTTKGSLMNETSSPVAEQHAHQQEVKKDNHGQEVREVARKAEEVKAEEPAVA